MTSKDIGFVELKKAKWIYLATLIGKSEYTAKKIVQFAKRNNIKVLFNPSAYLAKQGTKKLKTFLESSEIIILNKEEARFLLKNKKSKTEKMLIKLSKLGPNKVIITDGKKTLIGFDGTNFYLSKTPNVKVIHTAGSGDAFSSGFLAGIINGDSMEMAIKIGQANASSVVQHIGTKNKLLTRKEALSFIKRHKIKVEKSKV
ncbi:MAG: carbohydrate kinase family protein [Nanoarchaeota archaeon]|nr:carbohydrate kinase family protein [Nanoarchaeota archaeon]